MGARRSEKDKTINKQQREAMRKTFRFVWSFIFTALTAAAGDASGILAAAVDPTSLEGGGISDSGSATGDGASNGVPNSGIASETFGREYGDDRLYNQQVDAKITKIRPMATPVDQISRYAKSQTSKSFEVKYYSVGTRPISCTLTEAVAAQTSGTSVEITVDDPTMFTMDDTIRVVGVKGQYDDVQGKSYETIYGDADDDSVPDLMLCVCGRNESTGNPVVYAVNGVYDETTKSAIYLPAIDADTTLIRMGKACGEVDAQTGRFNNIPTADVQYCQNFMTQVEQSTFDKLASKEVDWNFSDLEEDAIYDMRLAMENTFLFGVKNKVKHTSKDGMLTWFTGGIWWMAGKDIEVGSYDSDKATTVISDEDLVDITKDLFVGTGIANRQKVLFCGSDFLSALSKIESEKFRLKDTVESWNLKFKSWDTDFGEILALHHELFDKNGMSDCAFALDPEYLSKSVHIGWSRNVLDLQKAGIRNTDAVLLQEASCLYLRYPNAHARLKLVGATEETAEETAEE